MMKYKPKPLVKVIIVLLFVCLIGFILVKTGSFSKAKTQLSNIVSDNSSTPITYEQAGIINQTDDVMNLSLDEWTGWKNIIDANGGLTTQAGSIFEKLGLKVQLSVINDATQSSNALVAGKLDGAGYTINRFAFLYPKFAKSNIPVKMAFVTNSSTGGDGIIAKQGINRIEDLVGKKIGIPRYSEAQTLVEWLLQKSSLNPDQIAGIRKNMVYFETPDDCAKAFFAGELDAGATWQPYLSQATTTVGAKLLFSTKNATNLVLDGIVFRQDYIDKNPDQVAKFIEGTLMAQNLYKTNTKPIKSTFPMFSTLEDKDIIAMTDDATLCNCKTNTDILKKGGNARNLFADMSHVWKNLGEEAKPDATDQVFDESFVTQLLAKFPDDKLEVVKFTDEQKTTAQKQDNNQALLTKKLTINFELNSPNITPDSFPTLTDFANTAKILNGTVIQIEGNTDSQGDGSTDIPLSTARANSVAKYLQALGVDPSRLVTIGNGATKPIDPAQTQEAYAKNRRTEAFFKVVN